MIIEYTQEYLNNLPEGQDFGYQALAPTGWEQIELHLYYKGNTIRVPRMLSYEGAAAIYKDSEVTCRVVKYSRYLADGVEVCIHSVKRYKEALK